MAQSIYARNLVKRYGSRTVVNHVSFEVNQGEIVGLLGPNGAGKTTSFYQVVGLVRPDEGDVFLNDQNITSLAMFRRAKMGIGYLPQEASVFRKLSVEDNILAVLEMTSLSRQEQRQKLESLLDEFRLHHVRKSNGDVLSGGERRRTEIARALAVDPKFILLDEPFAGIDPIAVEDIQAIVAKLKYKNIGILITDHNVTETLSICDRAYLLIEGRIYKHGTAEELAEDEQVRKLYLGRNFELKRKDYLHEEARTVDKAGAAERDKESIHQDHLAHSIGESIDKTRVILNFLQNQENGMAPDLNPQEYMRQLSELKISLLEFAKGKTHQQIRTEVVQLPEFSYRDYESIFESDEQAKSTGGLLTQFSSILHRKKLNKLKEQLERTDSVLSSCALYLKSMN